MSDTHQETVSIKILGREYKLRCLSSERDSLLAAGQHLDNEMRKIRDGGQILGTDRIAIMAALNIAHALTLLQSNHKQIQNRLSHDLNNLNQLIDEAISEGLTD